MNFRIYVTLFFLSGIALLGIALVQNVPGYMDADYYYSSGLRIANNEGWSDPFIWNYLSDPPGLPVPAFTYWMPFTGILAGLSMKITGIENFWGARVIFILLAACLAPLSAYLSYTFLPQRWGAILAGLLAVFSGFYYAYLPTTETFGIYMLLGGVLFLLIRKIQQDWLKLSRDVASPKDRRNSFTSDRIISPLWVYLVLGVLAGSMFLTRTDGLIWFGIGLLAIIFQNYAARKTMTLAESNSYVFYSLLISLSLFAIGFLIIISPWIYRNLTHFGSVIAPGSDHAIWLTEYDDLFIFPASQLSFERWISSGFVEIMRARGWAFLLNLVSSIAVQGGILLTPLIIAGMWVNRRDWRVSLGAVGWLSIFLVMTIIFPFQGARGGFFHASAALQPLLWALVPVGLKSFIEWGGTNRKWDMARALKIFSIGMVSILILVTFFTTWERLRGRPGSAPAWGHTEMKYVLVEEYLKDREVQPESIVMVNNPPGYFAMTGRPAIVIPHGDLNTTIEASKKYNASYLILDENHPQGLKGIYENPGHTLGLTYLESLGRIRLFKFEP
jgi:hypothetical protein